MFFGLVAGLILALVTVAGELAAPLAAVLHAAVQGLVVAVVLTRHGLLALAVFQTMHFAVRNTPITLDPSRFYFWRTGLMVAVVAAVAVWGFRNVLGRQRAFPTGALDA